MRFSNRNLLAAGSAIALLGVGGQAQAAGEDGRTLADVKSRAQVAINARLSSLNTSLTVVSSGSPNLNSADRSALSSLLSTDITGLTSLGQKIQADTALATARADAADIFSQYRVYALAEPQVHLVRATDSIRLAVLPALTDAQSALVKALQAGGRTAPSQMADLAAQIQMISTATAGLSATLLGFTPAQWNANHQLLAPTHQTLKAVRVAIRAARADIVAVRGMLQ